MCGFFMLHNKKYFRIYTMNFIQILYAYFEILMQALKYYSNDVYILKK